MAARRRLHRPVDVALVALRDAAEQRVVVRRPHLDRLVGGDELVADAHGTDLIGHRAGSSGAAGSPLVSTCLRCPACPADGRSSTIPVRWPSPTGAGRSSTPPREHDAGLRRRPSTSATATSRPTSTPRPTACSSPSTTTGSTGSPTAPGGSPTCPGRRWPRPGWAAGSRSRCSRTCSARSRTCGSTSTRSTTRAVEPLAEVITRTGSERPRVLRRRSPTARLARLRALVGPRLCTSLGPAGHRPSPGCRRTGCRRAALPAPCVQVPHRYRGRVLDRPSASWPPPTAAACRCTCGRSTTRPRWTSCSTSASTGS